MLSCILNQKGQSIKQLSDREKNYISCSRRGRPQEERTYLEGAQNTVFYSIRQETNSCVLVPTSQKIRMCSTCTVNDMS